MTGCIDTYVRPYETVIPNGYISFVKYCPVEIGKEAFAYSDVLTVITEEWLVNESRFITLAQHFL